MRGGGGEGRGGEVREGRGAHIFLTKTLSSIDSSLIPSCSARDWYTCSKPHPPATPTATPPPYLGGLMHDNLTDVDKSELLEEV